MATKQIVFTSDEVAIGDLAVDLYNRIGADLAESRTNFVIDVLRDGLADFLQGEDREDLMRIWQAMPKYKKLALLRNVF